MSPTAPPEEYSCFVGGLSWSTTDKGLENAFRPYGSIVDAKVVLDRDTGRSRGFGFVTFNDERSLHEAIDHLHGKEIDGRPISVNRAVPREEGGGFDRAYTAGGGARGYASGRGRGGGGGGGGSDECFNCGRLGHWARDCRAAGGDRFSSWDRYGGGRNDRYDDREMSRGRFVDDYDGGRYSGRVVDRYDRYVDPYSNGDGYGRDARSGGYYDRDVPRGSGPRYRGGYRERPSPYDRPLRGRGGRY